MEDFEPLLKLIWESEERDSRDSANTADIGMGKGEEAPCLRRKGNGAGA